MDWERGGTKFAETTNIQLINNYVHHNDGPGLWADLNAKDMLFANNTVIGNTKAGIYYEISYDAVIRDNYLEGNGLGFDPWLWGGGIVISSSPNVQIYGNTLVNNGDGIGAVEQDRSRDPARFGPLVIANLHVHHNTVTMSQGSERGRTGSRQYRHLHQPQQPVGEQHLQPQLGQQLRMGQSPDVIRHLAGLRPQLTGPPYTAAHESVSPQPRGPRCCCTGGGGRRGCGELAARFRGRPWPAT